MDSSRGRGRKKKQHALGYAVKDRSGGGQPEKRFCLINSTRYIPFQAAGIRLSKQHPTRRNKGAPGKKKKRKKVTLHKKVNHTLKE